MEPPFGYGTNFPSRMNGRYNDSSRGPKIRKAAVRNIPL